MSNRIKAVVTLLPLGVIFLSIGRYEAGSLALAALGYFLWELRK